MSSTPAGGQMDREDLRRGLIYQGLQRVSRSDVCRGNFRLRTLQVHGIPVCTHGPDPAPDGVDVREDRRPPAPPEESGVTEEAGGGEESGGDQGEARSLAEATQTPSSGTAAATGQVTCVGNGTDGYRVQLIYARASDRPDDYAGWLPSLRQYAAQADDVYNASAAETGGVRHIRFVHDSSCVPSILNVVLSPSGDDNFDNAYNELRAQGFNRTDRKYLLWMDANVYCGIAEVYYDDQAGVNNSSNGSPYVQGEIGLVGKACWGQANSVEAHELTHLLGGVQTSAPNATSGNHCTDNNDRLCYSDGTGFATVVCPDPAHENRLDCNHNDYYSTSPAPYSYLSTHWNVANSRFLTTSAGSTSPPTTSPPTTSPPTTTAPTTTTTVAPTTTTTAPPATTTTAPPANTTTTAPPSTTTTTTPPSTASLPSAPQSLFATQPVGGRGVLLYWSPPASPGSPPFTAYRIYRGTTSTNLTYLTDIGTGTSSYNDTATTSGALYWYAVVAVNSAGQGPRSNLTRMLAR